MDCVEMVAVVIYYWGTIFIMLIAGFFLNIKHDFKYFKNRGRRFGKSGHCS